MSSSRHEWFLNQVFRHRATLKRYLKTLMSSEEDIEDLIQETYLRIYGLRDYDEVESPKALLLRIAHNLAIERVRRRATQATDSVADFDALNVLSDMAPMDEQLDARRRFEAFCAAVDSLPPVCRRAFVLRKVYKLSQSEITAVLGMTTSTLEKHVVKGLRRCRDYFRDHGLMEDALGPAAPANAQTMDAGECT